VATSSAAGRMVSQTFEMNGKTPQDEALARALTGEDPPEPLKVVVEGPGQISVDDPAYKPATTAKSSGSKSPGDRFVESVADMERRIEVMNQETALLRQAGPMVGDSTAAMHDIKGAA